jgi:outer membrane receptor protein involved in Fe transport
LGWRISQENFMKNVNWVELKLKASYGAAGNDNLGSSSELYYQYIGYYYADGFGNYAPLVVPGIGSRKPNADLVWEANTSTNFGLEFTLFKRRLQGSIEIYDRRSKDLIFDVPQSPSSQSGSTQYQNIGQSKNTGIEFQIGYNAIRKKNFDWRIDFNISSFKNTITQLPPGQKERYC